MIELQHITKIFHPGDVNEVRSLNDLSLVVPKGEFLTLVGANGSGKTTLLNIIAGAVSPTAGSISLNNTDVTRLAEYKRSRWIARVFQDPLKGTASELSVLDNFRLAAIRTAPKRLRIGINESFRKRVRDQVANLQMGLENKLDQPMGTLSGGQRQALTLLMSVMDDTQILLLDEPTAALDPRSAGLIMETAGQLITRYQLTAVLITHNLKEALQYGNRLIQLSEGVVMKDLKDDEKKALTLPELYTWFE
jgi:putative ABC transport system ATP-binding protein